jgi:folylpolyglutamate synthase/dihydropteroate synthase
MSQPEPTPTPEPNYRFIDSRRLTGPNRYFDGPAVTLTPIGTAAAQPRALEHWAASVRRVSQALGWPDPAPVIDRAGAHTFLVFRAPPDAEITATELSEWAWETAAAETAAAGAPRTDLAPADAPAAEDPVFDRAHDFGADPTAVLGARAAAERDPALAELRAAAGRRGLPVFEDDEEISIGAGTGSRCWPRTSLPPVDAVPWSALHDIPTVLVTGSNGKTTTVRLLASIAAAAGAVPGYSSTEGIFVAGRPVSLGDYSGPAGARVVLRCSEVSLAVLETARGGILRRGLAVTRADAAVVTNVSADHFGEYGIDNANALAETKLVVAHAVCKAGTLVLNADDATLMAAAARVPHAALARRALFAMDHEHPALEELRGGGGSTCGVRGGRLVLHHKGGDHDLGELSTMPLSFGGAARYNVANLAAGTLTAAVLGLPVTDIRRATQRFGSLPEDNPGRLERWTYRGATVLIDYAHNPDGLAKLLDAARSLHPRRLSLLLGQAGNRDDHAIRELARTAVRFAPDRIAIKELPLMLRGRAPGEVSALLGGALLQAGMAADRLEWHTGEEIAALSLLGAAGAGDVIVLPIHTREVRERLHAVLGGEGD